MTDLINMDFEDNLVRSFRQQDGTICFIAKDVCNCLDVKQASRALENLDEDEKGVTSTHTPGGPQQVLYVTESGLYTLILRSRKAVTKGTMQHRFRKWVTKELIPTIMRTGSYHHWEQDPNQFDDLGTQSELGNKSRLVEIANRISGPRAACELWRKLDLPMVPSLAPRGGLTSRSIVSGAEEQLRSFIEEGCQLDPDYTMTARAMYLAYKGWARSEGNPIITETAFGRAMLQLTQDYNFLKNKGRVVTYRGLRVKEVG
ncbi:hypothetical protein PsAD13_02639 [Pseudovibrio sp. Ad13]|uniref:BRO-N domain-containing protein n=1 Tax=Pseudovibrio sp. Ad13 TaxID=989396 RepID=UPI0007AEB981|nr:BRO family protein [Pseudovibrio sp. Ad13]KZK83588.1 hypothetical protein PsAD13_02639 [Pseudovibrio sp. Ad13]